MTYKLVDVTRGKVLQEFSTQEDGEKALRRQSTDNFIRLELVETAKPKAKKAKAKKSNEE